jgi:hypothetical protein
VDLHRYRHADSVTVAAAPDRVWDRVVDVTRMGELSPICTGGEWDAGAGPTAGSWFTGHNDDGTRQWSTRCQVEAAEPGRTFRFVNYSTGTTPLVRWGYELEPDGDATRVTETWEVLADYPEVMAERFPDIDIDARLEERLTMAHDGIAATLAGLKAELEA